ncbi:DUF2796 domain-containing protein [Tahibacter soli]|uniref:DUF2796 domain-containing protein n=1 Tax=Tahibacter soli TaxID=2983605 RepID=A0A9X4BGI5_9GAMM|nr:DUF2796 domain-containing protein [Tahibacter soli]MDC8011113.1 DUF2796 domain-containing protein [Tahibacter soli]
MKRVTAILWLTLAPAFATAHGVHEHGAATLAVTLEGDRLELALGAPGASIVGFERAPRDDAERAALARAQALLAAPAQWIALPAAAGCALESSAADFDTAGEHADFDVRAAWRCTAPARLTTLDLTLFERFARLERVTANLVLPDRQDSRTLARGAARLVLAP